LDTCSLEPMLAICALIKKSLAMYISSTDCAGSELLTYRVRYYYLYQQV
jgi:hypothetical protein